jgi:hypothetical protein
MTDGRNYHSASLCFVIRLWRTGQQNYEQAMAASMQGTLEISLHTWFAVSGASTATRFPQDLSRLLVDKVQPPIASCFFLTCCGALCSELGSSRPPRGRVDTMAQTVAELGADTLFRQMYGERIEPDPQTMCVRPLETDYCVVVRGTCRHAGMSGMHH